MRFRRPAPLSTRPSVSVVIPCYNYGHYLDAAVRSALGQEGVEVDVLIVDDASPDGSGEVARALAAAEPRVDVLVHETNRGHITTYNDGLRRVRGDYVVLLSADDLLTPGSLVRAAAMMEACPEVGLVYGQPVRFGDEVPEARTTVHSWTVWGDGAWLRTLCRRGNNPIFSPEAMVRRSVVEAVLPGDDWYDPTLPHTADLALWLRVAARADVGRVNGADQAYYRIHADNMHTTTYGDLTTDLTERRNAFRSALAGGGTPADAAALALAERTLDRQSTALARKAAGPSRIESAVLGAVESLTWKLRWRRWRWFGT